MVARDSLALSFSCAEGGRRGNVAWASIKRREVSRTKRMIMWRLVTHSDDKDQVM